jgi:hypothetical protein
MANSKMIFECKICGQMYCGECSTNEDWQNFCSKECEVVNKDEDNIAEVNNVQPPNDMQCGVGKNNT